MNEEEMNKQDVKEERDREARGENNGYDDWFSDNRTDLMSDFIENHLNSSEQESWDKFVRDEFERWKADRE